MLNIFQKSPTKEIIEREKALDKREENFDERVKEHNDQVDHDNRELEFEEGLITQFNNLSRDVEAVDETLEEGRTELREVDESITRAHVHCKQLTADAKKEARDIVAEAKVEATGITQKAEVNSKREDGIAKAKLEVLESAYDEVVDAKNKNIESLEATITLLAAKLPEVNLDSFQIINNIPASQHKQGKQEKK